MARGLVEVHGGRIGVRNRHDGGALFTFTIPQATAPHGEAREPVAARGDGWPG